MSKITDDLEHLLEIADARLKGGDPHNMSRRVEETREVLSAVAHAVKQLDARLDGIERSYRIGN